MANVNDVAAAVMGAMGKPVPTLKLQKLLYYCQGWHLAWDGEPLFDATIEAWANGPVVREIYEQHRQKYLLTPPWPPGSSPSALRDNERTTVDEIVRAYGPWTADQLSQTTHRERPWQEARGDLYPTARGTAPIDTDTMQDFFTGMMMDDDVPS